MNKKFVTLCMLMFAHNAYTASNASRPSLPAPSTSYGSPHQFTLSRTATLLPPKSEAFENSQKQRASAQNSNRAYSSHPQTPTPGLIQYAQNQILRAKDQDGNIIYLKVTNKNTFHNDTIKLPDGRTVILESNLATQHELAHKEVFEVSVDRYGKATSTKSTASEKSLDLLGTNRSSKNASRKLEKTISESELQAKKTEVTIEEVKKESDAIINQAAENLPEMKSAIDNMTRAERATFYTKVQNIKEWTNRQIDNIWALKDSMPSREQITESISTMMEGLTRMLQTLIMATLYAPGVIITAVIALPIILAGLPVVIALAIVTWPQQ